MAVARPPEIVRTKVVATLGPASRAEDAIHRLVEAGVDVFRLNMAHGSIPEHQESLDRIRRVSEATQRPTGVVAERRIARSTALPQPFPGR